MRSTIILILLACCLPQSVFARELNEESIRLAAIKLTPDFDYEAYALALLKADRIAWRRTANDPEAQKKALNAKRKALISQVKKFDLSKPLMIGAPVKVRNYDPSKGGLPLEAVIKRNFTGYTNKQKESYEPGLPKAFSLVIPNLDLQTVWRRTAQEAEAFYYSRRDLPEAWIKQVYVEIEVQIVDLKGGIYVHAAVTKVSLYANHLKERVLDVWKEPRSAKQVIGQSWLSEGITMNAVPNHSVVLPGVRFLEPIRDSFYKNNCKDIGREMGHRKLVCTSIAPMPFFNEGIRLDRIYLGGRLVASEYRASRPLESKEINYLRRIARLKLNRRGAQRLWRAKGVEVKWDTVAMRTGEDKVGIRVDAIPYLDLLAQKQPQPTLDAEPKLKPGATPKF